MTCAISRLRLSALPTNGPHGPNQPRAQQEQRGRLGDTGERTWAGETTAGMAAAGELRAHFVARDPHRIDPYKLRVVGTGKRERYCNDVKSLAIAYSKS